MTSFSKSEALRFGWAGMKAHFWFFVSILIIAAAIQFFPAILENILGKSSQLIVSILFLIISIIFVFFKIIIDLGFIRIGLNVFDNKNVQISNLFGEANLWWKYLRAQILSSLIIVFGFILLIIPGIIWSIRLQYFSYFIVDQGMGPVAALQESWRITRGNVWNLFLFGLLTGLINLVGVLVLIIGLFAAIPTTMIAKAYVFRKLQIGNVGEQSISAGKLYAMAAAGIIVAGISLVLTLLFSLILISALSLSRMGYH